VLGLMGEEDRLGRDFPMGSALPCCAYHHCNLISKRFTFKGVDGGRDCDEFGQ
jgi:hypothetical protein